MPSMRMESDKDVQKQMRKLLFALKTVGIKVEQPKQVGEAVLKKVEEVRAHRALLSNYDYQGTRLVVAAYEIKKNAFMFSTLPRISPTVSWS